MAPVMARLRVPALVSASATCWVPTTATSLAPPTAPPIAAPQNPAQSMPVSADPAPVRDAMSDDSLSQRRPAPGAQQAEHAGTVLDPLQRRLQPRHAGGEIRRQRLGLLARLLVLVLPAGQLLSGLAPVPEARPAVAARARGQQGPALVQPEVVATSSALQVPCRQHRSNLQ